MPAKYRHSVGLCVLIENVFCMGTWLLSSPQACLPMVPGREAGGASEGTNEKKGRGLSNAFLPFTLTGLLLGVRVREGARG